MNHTMDEFEYLLFWSYQLALHVPLIVHKDSGQVLVGVVGDAGGGDGLDELGAGKAGSKSVHVFIYQTAQRHTLSIKMKNYKDILTSLVNLLYIIHCSNLPH